MPCHVPSQIRVFPAVVGDQRPCRQRSQGAAHPSRAGQRQQQRMHPGGGGQPYEGDHERDEEQPRCKRLEAAKSPHGVSCAVDHRTSIISIHPDRPCPDVGTHRVLVGELQLQPDLNRSRGPRHGRRSGSAACTQPISPVRPRPSANSRPAGRTGAAPSRGSAVACRSPDRCATARAVRPLLRPEQVPAARSVPLSRCERTGDLA